MIFSLLLGTPGPSSGQPTIGELEARLDGTAGRERLELLIELAVACREDRPRRTVAAANEGLELLASAPEVASQISLLNSVAYAHLRLQGHAKALSYAHRARRLAKHTGDRQALAFALRNLGNAYRSLDDYGPALEHSRQAARIAEETGDQEATAEALNDVGVAYRRMGDNSQALEYYLRSHRIFEELRDRAGIAQTLNNIGIIYRELERYEEALEFYRQALEIQQQENNLEAVARLYNNIGVVYRHLGESDRAIEHYQRSTEIKQELGDELGVARSLNNLGLAYEKLGDLEHAVGYYRRSLAIKEKLRDREGIGLTLQNIAGYHQQRGEHTAAIALLRRSLAIATELGARSNVEVSQRQLSESFAAQGRFEEALAAHRQYERVKNEILDARRGQAISELQARIEAERMAKEIELLEHKRLIDNLELRHQEKNRRMLAALPVVLLLIFLVLWSNRRRAEGRLQEQRRLRRQERERYIAELELNKSEIQARNVEMEHFTYTVSHDLRAPLITIRGFLGMLAKDLRKGDAERIERDLARIDGATVKMSKLLEDLLQLARLGKVVSEPEPVPLDELAREAVELLDARISEGGVGVSIAPDLPVVLGDRSRLLEVLQNLIDNAVKYMDEQEVPRIEVGWRRDGEETALFVKDNGAGIEPRYHDEVFDLFNRLDAEIDGTGVGLAVVRRIVEIHGGRIWVESEGRGAGSSFCFTLPVAGEASA